MWFYTCYFIHIYLLLFDGIPFATTTLAKAHSLRVHRSTQTHQTTPNQPVSVSPQDIWKELREVTEGSIHMEHRDKTPQNLFQPTSFLNPGYGVLFEHIGKLHQSVYKHYLIIAMKIPTLHHMPHEPEQWYKGCLDGKDYVTQIYKTNRNIFQDLFPKIFFEDYCAKERFRELYKDITKLVHTSIPALLPNQAVSYADFNFFNVTPSAMPKNIYHPHHPQHRLSRQKRNTEENSNPPLLPLMEVQRALDYFSKYADPIPLDADTIYAPTPNITTPHKRQKRFLGALIRGISSIFKGGNIFGNIVSGIKKVGGFIFKGIKGLLHRRKTTALLHAARTFAASKKFAVGKLYKFAKFRGLHIGRSSLSTTLRRQWHRTRFWLQSRFSSEYMNIARQFVTSKLSQAEVLTRKRITALMNYTTSLASFVNYRREAISYLEKTVTHLQDIVFGLETLANGQLSTALVSPGLLHKFLHKILREVKLEHPQFEPMYTDLHHYYESKMNSYSNDKDTIFIQIPIYFIAGSQKPLNLYRLHTVPVPLDKDTYDGVESKYTTLELPYKYLATNENEYMDISDSALESCSTYHMDHLCENLHVTSDVKQLQCAIAIYMDSVGTYASSPGEIQETIKTKCEFTYHEVLHPTPTTLQTQDEILLANFPTKNWQVICDEITDRPSFMTGALYTIINLNDLCTCGILTAEGRFLYESMRSCDHPDTKVQLHFTYNRALVNYDSSITAQDSKRYALQPYPFQAPDLQYFEHRPYLTDNGTLRVKRHVPDLDAQALAAQQFPLAEAVRKMETQEPIYIGPILPAPVTPDDSVDDSLDDIIVPVNDDTPLQENIVVKTMDKPFSNFLFNVVTLINTLMNLCLMMFIRCSFRPGGIFHTMIVQMVHMIMVDKIQEAKAVKLVDPLIAPPTVHTPLLDLPILEEEDMENVDPTPSTIGKEMTPWISFSKTIIIFIGILFACLVIWSLFKIFILPLCFKSNLCRQLCLSCFYNSHTRRAPTTDIFLDIIHIFTGQQIRIYVTTIAAPASSLAFQGAVKLKNFKILSRKFQLLVHIDWHTCLLIYNKFLIPLPDRGTAVLFQPNLLTDFNLEGPFNILLLARHMDTLIQIPHIDNQEFMSSTDKLDFDIESPYKKVQTEIRALLASAPQSSTGLPKNEHTV